MSDKKRKPGGRGPDKHRRRRPVRSQFRPLREVTAEKNVKTEPVPEGQIRQHNYIVRRLNEDPLLSMKEKLFVKYYTAPGSQTQLLAKESYVRAGYSGGTGVRAAAKNKLDTPKVRAALKDIFASMQDLDTLIVNGVTERLQDPQSRHWQPTADYVSKVRGDFAAEKHAHVHLNESEREDRYKKMIADVKREKGERDE